VSYRKALFCSFLLCGGFVLFVAVLVGIGWLASNYPQVATILGVAALAVVVVNVFALVFWATGDK
jgi:hypothetical protein